ncbi:MAG: threonine synthase, partial [Oscillospiraceae bacterium]|nr:threonine synthase [Oscillospiraceae bacterium]
VYYVYSYTELAAEGELKEGDTFNVVVPTGNFGNILAAYYAKLMGVPVGKLVCASNDNCVLTDFFATGTYNKNRPFYATTSPSMDILVSSNLERLLYLFSGENDEVVRQWYDQMAKTGTFTVSEEVKQLMDTHFYAAFADEEQVADTIAQLFDNYGYLCDTHTAVGFYAALEYKEETGDNTPIVVASTASPYKFADSVIEALGETPAEDDFERLEQLYAISGFEIPEKLASLQDKEVRFTDVCTPDKMLEAVLNNK